MAAGIWVTSLIRPRITVQQVAGKNGHRTTVFARFGLLDMRAQAEALSALRADTPTRLPWTPLRPMGHDQLHAAALARR
jgi:hypothetical protein